MLEKDGTINISPYASKGDVRGEVIVLHGVSIRLPQQPSDKHIVNAGKPIKQQKWERLPVPDDFEYIDTWEDFEQLPQAAQDRLMTYINEEWRRRKEGLWVYIKGKAYYFTGEYYMFLQWQRNPDFDLNDGYGFFYKYQWEQFIHMEAGFKHPKCCGQITGKIRRGGWTTGALGFTLCKTTRAEAKNKVSGMTSKAETDAKEVLYDKLLYIYEEWPFFFRVAYHESGDGIIFAPKKQQITTNRKDRKKSNALNSRIRHGPTKNNTFDGWALYIMLADEIAKLRRPVTLKKFWEKHKPTLYDRYRIRGFALMGTTAEEIKKDDKEGMEDFKVLYNASDPARAIDGETKSGLWKYFLSAYETMVIDEYGMSIVEDPDEDEVLLDPSGERILEGAKTIIQRELKKRTGDTAAINEYKRLYPVTESDMFRVIGGNSLDTERIYAQIQHNEGIVLEGSVPFRQGVFAWEGEPFKSPVTFVDQSNGQWRITQMLNQEHANKSFVKNGHPAPANEWLGCGGVDPYRTDQTVDGRGSSGSCHIVFRFNMAYPEWEGVPVARYNGRPETLYIFSEQILMAHIYFGVPCLIENNVDVMIRHWQSLGYHNYMLRTPKNLLTNSNTRVQKYGLSTSGENVRHSLLLALQTMVREKVGKMDNGAMGKFYFNETLYDLANFDIHDATKNDDSMSLGIALLGLQSHVDKKVVPVDVNRELVRKFDNSGNVSRLIK